jgi:hypothetical protein
LRWSSLLKRTPPHSRKSGQIGESQPVKTALIDEKGCKKGAKTCPFAPSLVQQNQSNSFGKNGGDDETRTRDLCRDRAAF